MEELVKVSNVTFKYPDGTTLNFHGQDFTVNKGERVVILGPNGSGKSTLLSLLLGLLRTNKGDIEVLGVNPAKDYEKIREKIEARNSFENYIYNVRNTTDGEEFRNKIGDEKCKQLNDIITENIQWIDDNDDLTKEEYDNKQKEIESIIRPILVSAYQDQSETAQPGSNGDDGETKSESDPNTDDLDVD